MEIAKNYPSHADFDRALDKLEARFEKSLKALLDTYFSTIRNKQ